LPGREASSTARGAELNEIYQQVAFNGRSRGQNSFEANTDMAYELLRLINLLEQILRLLLVERQQCSVDLLSALLISRSQVSKAKEVVGAGVLLAQTNRCVESSDGLCILVCE